MDIFPQEIIDAIVGFLPRYETIIVRDEQYGQHAKNISHLPPFASISRKWKDAVESLTFHSLHLRSTDFLDFKEIVSKVHRPGRVKDITVDIIIPHDPPNQHMSSEELFENEVANNESFSEAWNLLFDITKAWEEKGYSEPLELCLSNVSFWAQGAMKPYRNESNAMLGQHRSPFVSSFEAPYIRLIGADALPVLQRVTRFEVKNILRRLAPSVAPRLACKFRNVEHITWDVIDIDSNELHNNARMGNRSDFARAIRTNSWTSIKSANIKLYHNHPSNQNDTLPVIVEADLLFDPVSAALRQMTYNLTTLYLTGTIDPTIFWPHSSEENSAFFTPPTWPHLRTISVDFDMTTPSGEWYFTGTTPTPSLFASQFRSFRTTPSPTHIEPLLLAFAKAAQNMPALERGAITCLLTDPDNNTSQFEVSYMAAGIPAPYGDVNEEEVNCRRVYYETDHWFPRKEIEYELLKIGREVHGEAVLERSLKHHTPVPIGPFS